MAVSELAKRTAQTDFAAMAHADDANRVADYQRAWAAYEGDGPLPFDDEDGQADDNIRLDYPRLIVDKSVSFLAGKGGVEFQLKPAGEATERVEGEEDEPESEPDEDDLDARREAAEAELDDAWPEEDRHADFHRLGINGAICGQVWVRLHEDGRVSVLDPSAVTVVWDENDLDVIREYLIEWNTVNKDTGMGVLRRKRIEPDRPEKPSSWTITDEEWDPDWERWIFIAETPWRHAYAPVIGCQNLPSPNTCYGTPDLTSSVLDMIEQMESVASDMRRIVRLHGHPILAAIGLNADQVQEIDVAIGELLALPGEKSRLDQVQVAELTASLELYKELKTALFEAVRVPRVALGDRDKSGAASGVALQVEYAPLVELTETKRLTYGGMLRKTLECILDLRGFPNWKVTLGWPQLLPADAKSDAETGEVDQRTGIVSKQTLAEKRGYDWQTEKDRIAEERLEDQRQFDGGLGDDNDDLAATLGLGGGDNE